MPIPRSVLQSALLIVIDEEQRGIALAKCDHERPQDAKQKWSPCGDMQEVQAGYGVQKSVPTGRGG